MKLNLLQGILSPMGLKSLGRKVYTGALNFQLINRICTVEWKFTQILNLLLLLLYLTFKLYDLLCGALRKHGYIPLIDKQISVYPNGH